MKVKATIAVTLDVEGTAWETQHGWRVMPDARVRIGDGCEPLSAFRQDIQRYALAKLEGEALRLVAIDPLEVSAA